MVSNAKHVAGCVGSPEAAQGGRRGAGRGWLFTTTTQRAAPWPPPRPRDPPDVVATSCSAAAALRAVDASTRPAALGARAGAICGRWLATRDLGASSPIPTGRGAEANRVRHMAFWGPSNVGGLARLPPK